ncbi:MAG: hypothetical protein EZS28_000340 [Streblomastix strix]|uniref:Uncharacterized protein n=1 Tax=Streblomastix strix TaxID=222440 RepID=A0A5J4XAB7_9EUKA|nr:MAG: hypothetical protein EZS28_000340 [Streblomastix strix]
MAETQPQLSRFAQYLQKKQTPLSEEQENKKNARKQKLVDGRTTQTTGLNAKQLQALIDILSVKQNMHKDMKYNQELRTIPSGEAYIFGKKGMQGYTVRMVDPEGEGPISEFATIYTNKGKLYSIGGYIPKDESKNDKYREQYIASVPKGQRKNNKFFNFMQVLAVPVGAKRKYATYIPDIAQEFRETNQIEKWGRGQYMAAAQVTWREVAYYTQVNTDEEAFATEIDRLYNQVAPAAINEATRKQEAITKISIAGVNRLLQLYDSNTDRNAINNMNRSMLSSILTKIGFYGQRNNVNAVEQAINAVVSRRQFMKKPKQQLLFNNVFENGSINANNNDQHEKSRYKWNRSNQQKYRYQDIKQLREEFDPELLDEEAGAAIPSLKQRIKRREIYYVDYSSRIAEAKYILNRVNGVEFRDNYKGFDFVNDIDNFINKEYVNVHMYTYESDSPHYELTQNYIILGSDKQFNILFINDGIKAHIMHLSDVETLTRFRLYNIRHKQAFRLGDPNLQTLMINHMKKCQENNGKIVKKVILEIFAKPFVPHILSKKTYKYLLANNLTHLFKLTRYYITYDIETLQKKVNEKFGDRSQITATLIPYAIASTVKCASGIHSFYYDIRTENFLDKWLDQVFEEAKQVMKDNKYIDETIPQYYEVPVIGFNSAKFDASVLFKNFKSKNWAISKYLGSSTIAKQIIVKHQSSNIHLRFVDFKIYTTHSKLKDAVRDFGNGTYKKGRFPHEFINTNNYMDELNKCEPFPIEAFDNQLRNKKLSEVKYKEYLVEAANILIEPIDYLIDLMFKYKVDMLANISMSQCSNAIKYSMAYNGFDINGDYNSESTDKSIEITMCYWRAKVDSYIEQDNKKNRDSNNNVTIDDYGYFKELFKNQRCHMCNARFTWKNRPTLDRIDNKLGHSKDNVLPCCLYCNTCKANRDVNQMKLMIQLRKYALFKQLPMTLISDEGYHLLRNGITGGLSQVMHRYNIAGQTKINHFEFDKEDRCVYSIDSDYVQTHVHNLLKKQQIKIDVDS